MKKNVIICSRFAPDSEKNPVSYSNLDDFLSEKNLHREFHSEINLINKQIVYICRCAIDGSINLQGLFPDLVNCTTVIGPSDVAKAKSSQVGFVIL